MYSSIKPVLGTITMIAAAVLSLCMPAYSLAAGTENAQLIDKDFETALTKFVCKRFFNRIDADDKQREKLSQIIAETQEQTRPLREEFRRGLLQLSEMMTDNTVKAEDIKLKSGKVREMHEKIQDMRLSAALQIREVLTDKQRQLIHNRITQLISGGLSPRKIGFILQGKTAEPLSGESIKL